MERAQRPNPWAGRFPPEPCPRCDGKGKMYRRGERAKDIGTWSRCTRCGGTGRCPRRPPELARRPEART